MEISLICVDIVIWIKSIVELLLCFLPQLATKLPTTTLPKCYIWDGDLCK